MLMISERLFLETDSSAIRNNILFFMRRSKRNNNEYFEFLLEILSLRDLNSRSISAVLRIFADVYYDRKQAFDICMKHIFSPDQRIRFTSLQCVLRYKFFQDNILEIYVSISGYNDSYFRRYFVERVAKRKGLEYIESVIEPIGSGFLDYLVPLDDFVINSIARRKVISTKMRAQAEIRAQVGRLTAAPPTLVDPKIKEVEYEASIVRRDIEELIASGIPFRFEPG